MGFTTVPEALRAAGRSAGDAMGELRRVDCAGPVAELAGALPGAKAAGAASSFGNSWRSAFTAWCADADEHVASLGKAADTYVAGDAHAQSSLPSDGKLTAPR
ncbi:hypothetical protein [Amycolatopsis sp. NPDC059021]|uniref:hypothetical protein n=1 Tax=Amycolatopsis sp. NPDC059021 TaxID=3346704 RepID=UPI00366E2BA5